MLWSFCVLLACQTIGEVIHTATALPVPGTILGIGLLVTLLACRGPQPAPAVLPAADALLPYLSLMFVPPGVVAVLRMRAVPEAWLPIAVATIVSSALALCIAGRLAQALLNRSPGPVGLSTDPRGPR
jgi:holin-like protein